MEASLGLLYLKYVLGVFSAVPLEPATFIPGRDAQLPTINNLFI